MNKTIVSEKGARWQSRTDVTAETKAMIVDGLARIPFPRVQRSAARLVRVLWSGFREA